MSRRTSEANKAIAAAWSNEQQLVSEGKGTRDWTPEQQQDILEKGKAYDENGKAFEGHHMKSAEAYPEYQGDPENIQFLSRAEHFDAHGGNFQNPTNGYYDPETGETKDFGENKYEPCEVKELSEPIAQKNTNTEEDNEAMNNDENKKEAESAAEDENVNEGVDNSSQEETMSDIAPEESPAESNGESMADLTEDTEAPAQTAEEPSESNEESNDNTIDR